MREIQSLGNAKILSPQLLEQKKSVGSYVVETHYNPPESTGQINTEGQASSRNHQAEWQAEMTRRLPATWPHHTAFWGRKTKYKWNVTKIYRNRMESLTFLLAFNI